MLDSRLKFITETVIPANDLNMLETTSRFGVTESTTSEPRVRVLVQVEPDIKEKALTKAGLNITAHSGDVVTGDIAISKLEALDRLDEVILIEGARPMISELDVSLPEARVNPVHTGPPGLRGAGVIVGIIDSGIDWRHQAFRNATGKTRVLRIWDQSLTPIAGESSPAPFGYGVEYNAAHINTALTAANPLSVVRHMDDSIGHGTHVSGIAAGDGSVAGNGVPAFTYVGVAPEADIVVVANRVTTDALGDSASTLDAVQYIVNLAQSLGRPCVINLSQGDNIGPHDGTSLLERGIDNLLGGQGRLMVKSAGNAANGSIHASGNVTSGQAIQLPALFPASNTSPDTIDIWYAGADRFSLRITPPGGNASATVNPGSSTTLNFPGGNQVFVDSVIGHPNNGDNRIYLQFSKGSASSIAAGSWTIRLGGTTVVVGKWHAWIERGSLIPQFTGPFRNDAVTISVPGTAHEVITAASYITKGAGVGNLATSSSRGPTRDGRQAPTLAAPGQSIMSAAVGASGTNQYVLMGGTSMAAPHVTGVIALMLQAKPKLTQEQAIKCLTNKARSDAFTGSTPNSDWGAGKMDAQQAVQCVSQSTPFTPFTTFTLFTGFTKFTLFTPFTKFSPFTSFTKFTLFTPFTKFTAFSRFDPHPDPISRPTDVSDQPFLRYRGVLFEPGELAIDRFPQLDLYVNFLTEYGINRLDQLVTLDGQTLSQTIGLSDPEAAQLVATAQQLLRDLAS